MEAFMEEIDYTMEELLPIAIKLTEKFTKKESTSVTYERAESLMEAVIYCVNESREGEIADFNKKITAMEAYSAGYDKVVQKAIKANNLYNEIISDFCDYGNLAYKETILEGMPEFFKRYDARFCPQDHLLTLDYPLVHPIQGLSGVDLIYEYLQSIKKEQEYLMEIPYNKVIGILKEYHKNYKDLFINIAETVAIKMEPGNNTSQTPF